MSVRKLLVLAAFIATPAFAAEYKIDPDHTTVGFKVRHLAISTVPGTFSKIEGTFDFDPANMQQSSAEAAVSVESVDTQQTKRDTHLKSPDFFDAAKYPVMKFKSREIKDATKEGFKLVGDLTIKDVTKPVVFDVTYNGTAKDPWGNERAAFSATTKVNRRDFGLNYNKVIETGALVVGDEVTVTLEVEGIRKTAPTA